ncbi:hypothetical protein DFH28DRAFT_936317 [Melampsora americana]|nr:hypothetical protein DFH28DRAFT_936317 [Melampsora americana]
MGLTVSACQALSSGLGRPLGCVWQQSSGRLQAVKRGEIRGARIPNCNAVRLRGAVEGYIRSWGQHSLVMSSARSGQGLGSVWSATQPSSGYDESESGHHRGLFHFHRNIGILYY